MLPTPHASSAESSRSFRDPPRTRIKICGITRPEDAIVAATAGADAIGLVFAPGSRRRVEVETAAAIIATLPPMVTTVGVFADQPVEEVRRIARRVRLGVVQLHGESETPTMVADLAREFVVVRGFRFAPEWVQRWGIDEVNGLSGVLVDGSAGGMGRAFDWASARTLCRRVRVPLILAGGLHEANVGEAMHALRPWAVDVSSGVESGPGIKDAARIHAFCHAVRRADAAALPPPG